MALENQPDTTTDGTKMKACLLSNTVLVEFVKSLNFLKKTADSSELLTIMHVFPLNFCQGVFASRDWNFSSKPRMENPFSK